MTDLSRTDAERANPGHDARQSFQGDGMRGRVLAIALTLATLIGALPVAGSLWVAWGSANRARTDMLDGAVHEMLARYNRMSTEIDQVFHDLSSLPLAEACEPVGLMRLRAAAYFSHGVREVAVIEDGRILCTGAGKSDMPASLPLPDMSEGDVRIWYDRVPPGVRAPASDVARSTVIARNGFALFLDTEQIYDLVLTDPRTVLSMVSLTSRQVMGVRSRPERAMLSDMVDRFRTDPPPRSLRVGNRLIVAAPTADGSAMALAAQPIDVVLEAWRQQAVPLGLLGLTSGAIIFWLILTLARRGDTMGARIRRGLARGEFRVVYQPIVRLSDGACLGGEALVRWQQRDGTMISPDRFIPVAEAEGLIERLTDQIIEHVFADIGEFLAERPTVWIAINLSAPDVESDRVRGRLDRLRKTHGVAAGQIVLEATERTLIDARRAQSSMRSFRDAGYRLTIDDFGTGYSSLAYLATLPVDGLKLDKTFVDSIGSGTAADDVMGHILSLAATLGLDVAAEGIEHGAQADYLIARGVTYGQGWLFARAMEAETFGAYVDGRMAVAGPPSRRRRA
ncbi:EAL domain-containing protein [Tistrella sp. 25B02-3]|jgi:sensor c-di-GMP phosphodiesterase-like protein